MTNQERNLEALHLAIYLEQANPSTYEVAMKQFAAFIGDGELAPIRLGCLKAVVRERSAHMSPSKVIMRADEYFALVNPPPPPAPTAGKRGRQRRV